MVLMLGRADGERGAALVRGQRLSIGSTLLTFPVMGQAMSDLWFNSLSCYQIRKDDSGHPSDFLRSSSLDISS